MSNYENAPTTEALATTCLVCGRPLVDATSVEIGIGPVCRENLGMDEGTAENRGMANKLVHAATLAAQDGNMPALVELCGKIALLGYPQVAELVQARFPDHFAAVVITPAGNGCLRIKARYLPAANFDLHNAGATWDKQARARFIPDTPEAKRRLFQVLKKHYAGQAGIGPKGAFTL